MWSYLRDGFADELDGTDGDDTPRTLTIATGALAAPLIQQLTGQLRAKFTNTDVRVVSIKNRFFGETVTVAGLTTGGDLTAQLSGTALGERVLIPKAMLKADEDIFLDDMTLEQAQSLLGVPVVPVGEEPYELIDAILG